MGKLTSWLLGKKEEKKEAPPAVDTTDPGVTQDLPAIPYEVLHSDIPFFSDPSCTRQVPEARIVILQAQNELEPDVVPSFKRYRPGQVVNWVLNNKKMFDEAWYRNPATGEIEHAWSACVEFKGRVVAADARRLNRFEREDENRRQG